MEELGRGAFGKVHRGALKELPKVEIFDKPRDQRVEIQEAKVVAIKTLLGEQKDIYDRYVFLFCYNRFLVKFGVNTKIIYWATFISRLLQAIISFSFFLFPCYFSNSHRGREGTFPTGN